MKKTPINAQNKEFTEKVSLESIFLGRLIVAGYNWITGAYHSTKTK